MIPNVGTVLTSWLLIYCFHLVHAQDIYVSNGTSIIQIGTTQQVIINKPKGHIVGLAVDTRNRKLFWSDMSSFSFGIFTADMDGRNERKIIADGILVVHGLTVDWKNRLLYWTDAGMRTIEQANYDGQKRRIILSNGLLIPRGIQVDPQNGYLYWGDQAAHQIGRCRPDGSEAEHRFINNSATYWPNQLVIDVVSSKLYWVDGWTATLHACNLNGLDCAQTGNLTYALSNVGPLFGVAKYGENVYVSTLMNQTVYDVTSGDDVIELWQGIQVPGYLFSIASLDENNQPGEPGTDPCANQCTNEHQVCLVTGPGTYRCTCPTFGGLVPTNQNPDSCQAPQEFLLWADAGTGEVGLTGLLDTQNKDKFLIAKRGIPVAVAYDPEDQRVYFSDQSDRTIYRVYLDGTGLEKFLDADDGIAFVDGMAMDTGHRRLYFTNQGAVATNSTMYTFHRIEMIGVDGTGRYSVVTDVDKPRGLWVDRDEGLLYYTDWGDQARVSSRNLDGFKSSETVVKSDMRNPNGVFGMEGNLYVVDSNNKSGDYGVLYATVNGSDWTETTGVGQTPFGITGKGDNLYISDWGTESIMRVDVTTGSITPLLQGLSRPTSLLYTQRNHPLSAQGPACDPGLSPCDDICVLQKDPNKATCLCSTDSANIMDQNLLGCQADKPDTFLLVADLEAVKLVSLTPAHDRTVYTLLQRSTYSNIAALVMEEDQSKFYFSDSNTGTIYASTIDGASVTVVYRTQHVIESMTLVGRKLYWTASYVYNETGGGVYSINVNGDESSFSEIITGLANPRGIAVDPTGYVYWTEWGVNPRVRKSPIDEPTIIFSNVKVFDPTFQWVNGLYFDELNRRLYVAASGENQRTVVYRCLVDDICTELIFASKPEHVHSILATGRFLYITNWETQSVERLDLYSMEKETISQGFSRPTQLGLVEMSVTTETGSKLGDCPSSVGDNTCDTLECANDWGCEGDQRCCYRANSACSKCVDPAVVCTATDQSFTVSLGPRQSYTSSDGCTIYECMVGGQLSTTSMGSECQMLDYCDSFDTVTVTGQCCPKCRVISACSDVPKIYNCEGVNIELILPDDDDKVTISMTSPELRAIYAESCSGQRLDIQLSTTTLKWKSVPQTVRLQAHGRHDDALCDVSVTVKDVTPPQFLSCTQSQTAISVSRDGRDVYWTLPTASDNSGSLGRIAASDNMEPGHLFPAPSSRLIRYTAYDGAANFISDCTFWVNVTLMDDLQCPAPPSIQGGYLRCVRDSAQQSCTIDHCYTGYIKNHVMDLTYTCDGSIWYPSFPTLFSLQACQRPARLLLSMSFSVKLTDCPNSFAIYKRDIIECLEIGNLCPDKQAGTIPYQLCVLDHIEATVQSGSINIDGKSSSLVPGPDSVEEATGELRSICTRVVDFFSEGKHENYCSRLSCPVSEASLDNNLPQVSCGAGFEQYESPDGQTYCVSCTAGSYYEATTRRCRPCAADMYQEKEAQMICWRCPDGHTSREGSFLLKQCTKKEEDPTQQLSVWIIAVCAVVGVIALAAIIAVTVCVITKRKRKDSATEVWDSHRNPAYDSIGEKREKEETYDDLDMTRDYDYITPTDDNDTPTPDYDYA